MLPSHVPQAALRRQRHSVNEPHATGPCAKHFSYADHNPCLGETGALGLGPGAGSQGWGSGGSP